MATRSRRSLAVINNGNKPYVGRRTGKVIDIKARVDEFGFERISDYFPDTDSDSDHDSIPQRRSFKNDKNINSSKLNKSKQSASSRKLRTEQNITRNSPVSRRSQNKSEILPNSSSFGPKAPSPKCNDVCLPISQEKPPLSQEKPVLSPEKQISSPEEPVLSPDKQVSSPEFKRVLSPDKPDFSPDKPVFLPEKQVHFSDQPASSLAKQDSLPEKQVSSPNKSVSPSDQQVLATVGKANQIPSASVYDSAVVVHQSPENTNLGSTRKRLQFSFTNTSLIQEETDLEIKESLTTTKPRSENKEEEYDVKERRGTANTKKTTAKKSTKSTKSRRNGKDQNDNIDEQLTQEICKSNDTFLTLKNKPNNTIREMLHRSTNSKIVTVEDTPEHPSLSAKNPSVPKNSQTSLAEETLKNPTKKSSQNETTISTKAPTTKKNTTSKIPVRKRKGPKLTFQDRSRRKSSPKTEKASSDVTPQKAKYRKTPATKSGLRKAKTANAENLDADDFEEGVADACNTTFTLQEPTINSSETTSKIPISQRTTRRKQGSLQQRNKETISENSLAANVSIHFDPDLSPILKEKSVTKAVSIRSVTKEAPVSSKRNLRSRKVDKTVAVVEKHQENGSIEDTSIKKNTTVAKSVKNKQTPARNKNDVSPNVSRESLENQTDSETEASNEAVHSPIAPAPINNSSFSLHSDGGRDSDDDKNETKLSRKRKLASETNRSEKETTKTGGKRGAKTGKAKAKSQAKAKTPTENASKNSEINSEYSSGFSSDDKLATTTQAAELCSNTVDSSVSTAGSESVDVQSTIKAPRNKKKRVIPQALEASDNTGDGLRRSQRNRVPCLQYWKNERIEYERRQSGLVVKDIIVNPTPAPIRRKRRGDNQQTKQQSKKAMQDKSPASDESDSSDIEIPDGMAKETDSVATVIDPDTLEEVQMNVVHSGKNLDLKKPNSDQEESSVVDSPLLVHKYFSQKRFGAGQILLRPGAEKGRQHVRRDTMIFHVISGRLLFSIHNQGFVLSKGSSFFVPAGNVYNIKNLDNRKDARLIFSQIKNQQ